MASGDLQLEADTVLRLAPEITPDFLPEAAAPDILELAERGGDQGAQALLEVLAAAGEDVEECQACGEEGELAIAPENDKPEYALLRPTFTFTPDYILRQLSPRTCKFLCGLCRQIRSTTSLLSELQRSHDADLVEGLLEHLSAVNNFDYGNSASACYSWCYGLLSRAYALKIASSGYRAWTLMNPNGSQYQIGRAGSAADLALQLLLPTANDSERKAALQSALGENASNVPEAGNQKIGAGEDLKTGKRKRDGDHAHKPDSKVKKAAKAANHVRETSSSQRKPSSSKRKQKP